MIQLNLLPDVKKEFIKAQRTKRTVIGVAILITLGSVGLAVLLAAVVYLVQPGLIAVTQNSINSRSQELKSVPDIDRYLTIQNQLESLPQLHQETVVYSRMFEFFKILNPAPPNNINLTSLNINTETKLASMTGITAGFKAFSVFEGTLRNAEVRFTDASGEKQTAKLFEQSGILVREQVLANRDGQEELNFTVDATYNPDIFVKGLRDIELSIPSIQTTQSVNDSSEDDAPVFKESE